MISSQAVPIFAYSWQTLEGCHASMSMAAFDARECVDAAY